MNRPLLTLAALYLAQSIPLLLIGMALPPILRQKGFDLATIGAIGLLLIPWSLKFLWAPLVDRYGTRRHWIVAAQCITLAAMSVLALLVPAPDVRYFFAPLLVISFASATQDIATDGYAVEHLPVGRQHLGSAVQAGAGAAGVIIGGSLTLAVFDFMGWRTAILGAALLSAIATLPALWLKESDGCRADVPRRRRPSIRHFLKRPEAAALLGFAFLFRAPEGFFSATLKPYLVDQGLTLTSIGNIYGSVGALLGIVGAIFSAAVIRGLGIVRFLWAVVILRSLIYGTLTLSARSAVDDELLLAALAALHAVTGYVGAVAIYVVFFRVASLAQAGTDFTLLSSCVAFSIAAGSVAGGFWSEHAGYTMVFALGSTVALVGGSIAARLATSVSHRHAAPQID